VTDASNDPTADDHGADVALVQRLAAVPRILSVCLRASGMGVVAVARVTAGRWVACAVLDRMGFGLPVGGELPVDTTLCGQVRDERRPIVIEHASREAEWCEHPTPRTYGYESHVSVPILLPDGAFWGTLVAIDPKPLPVRAPDTVATFTLFAELLALQIDAERRLEASRAALEEARNEAAMRERFIAVLGHDLRNPLASIDAGTRLLGREPLSEGGSRLLGLMRDSVARMAGLVDDVLDFARGRLGGGIPTRPVEGANLASVLHQILSELRSIHPNRAIEARIGHLSPVACDPRRIGQMLSNLVANALIHGAPDQPIRVEALSGAEDLAISVANGGAPIPAALIEDLFEPFARGPGADGHDGLGLGLFIAAEIARAHGGHLTATTGPDETRLTFTMPLARAAARSAA
jgi:hypothetical protein